MALVIGHSQTKYLSDYLSVEDYSVFSYPGYRTSQFLEQNVLFEVSSYFSVRNFNLYLISINLISAIIKPIVDMHICYYLFFSKCFIRM